MARRRGTASGYRHSAAGRKTSRKLTKRESENIAKAFFWIFFGWWLILLKLMFWNLPVAIIKAVKKKNRPQQTINNANVNSISQNVYNSPSISKAPSQSQSKKIDKTKQIGWTAAAIGGVFVILFWSSVIVGLNSSSSKNPNTIPTASDLAIISEMVSEEPSKDISVEEIVESTEEPVESKEESVESKAESVEKSIVSEISVKRETSVRREPSVVSRVEQVVNPQPREFTFYLNTKTKVYHTTMCGAASQILPENLRTVTTTLDKIDDTAHEIEQEGYRLCKKCK